MIVLSQNNCIQCEQLKAFLKNAIKVEYKEIKREENEAEFNKYVNQFNILSTPAIIINNQCLVGWTPSKVMEFIKSNQT